MKPHELIAVVDKIVQITDVLDLFGHPYKGVPGQLQCPCHALGQEKRFSARLYEDNYIYCFCCGQQYSSSQIYAALGQKSRETAAKEMLEKWPPTDQKLVSQIVHNLTAPRKKTVPQAFLDNALQTLLKFKHKVPLDNYREWCIRLNHLEEVLIDSSDEERLLKLNSFKQILTKELTNIFQ